MASPQLDFIRRAAPGAKRGFKEFGVPASVTIAQAILESGWGKSHIGTANNYFGIKAQGPSSFGPIAIGTVTVPTREVINGQSVMVSGRFRKYRSMDDSMRDHGRFLRDNPRYKPAFAHSRDANAFAQAIHRAGYATGRTRTRAGTDRSLAAGSPRRQERGPAAARRAGHRQDVADRGRAGRSAGRPACAAAHPRDETEPTSRSRGWLRAAHAAARPPRPASRRCRRTRCARRWRSAARRPTTAFTVPARCCSPVRAAAEEQPAPGLVDDVQGPTRASLGRCCSRPPARHRGHRDGAASDRDPGSARRPPGVPWLDLPAVKPLGTAARAAADRRRRDRWRTRSPRTSWDLGR